LPMIKRARAATEPALEYITKIAHEAAHDKTRNLVLLSGVPGSGKTLVGLQLVHSGWVDDLAVEREGSKPAAPAVYLSGNGPLVEVLQHALKDGGGEGRTFVQAIKKYVDFYSRRGAAMPPEHLIVFDEAQRAHDAERVAKVHKKPVAMSEPQHLIEFCGRIPDWCVLVALIGDGQAIHTGEEAGISLWAEAISATDDAQQWQVHGSPSFSQMFESAGMSGKWNDVLNLDTEIRFHLTPKVHEFVAGILGGMKSSSMALLGDVLYQEGHRFLVSRDLNVAQSYLKDRYEGATEARYGILASSKDKWLLSHGVDNSYMTTKRLKVGPWYNYPSSSPESCCQLQTVATEFSSQGLELDCALLAWGSDLLWENGDWTVKYGGTNRPPLKDPQTVRKNVYRVLLTRGRDGTVIYIPKDERMNATYERLVSVGMRELV
ncbi:MAG: DNA/RNA helicase domain-containing protein, partial [Gammaproteobacteria bacterium]